MIKAMIPITDKVFISFIPLDLLSSKPHEGHEIAVSLIEFSHSGHFIRDMFNSYN